VNGRGNLIVTRKEGVGIERKKEKVGKWEELREREA